MIKIKNILIPHLEGEEKVLNKNLLDEKFTPKEQKYISKVKE